MTTRAAVTLHRLHDGDLAAEAERVVEIVRAARARDPATSIAVLVASREHVALSAVRLRAAGFALRGVDLERLRDRPVIRDLAALTRALLHPGDRSAWLALLRAPWCALTLAELEALSGAAGGDMFELLRTVASPDSEPAPALRLRLLRLYRALAPAILGAERGLPLWQRVEHSWLRLAAPAIHRAEVDRLDAQRFIDALALHDDPQRLVGEALGELTERLYSGAPPQPGAIELMTVHAAKGLEWDLVILPGLGRSTAVDTDPLLHWIELPGVGADTELLLAPIRATPQEPRCSLAGYIKRLQRDRARLERVRLLYVAATRARSALHLLAALPLPADPDRLPAPRAGSLLNILWPAIGEQFLALTPAPGAPAPAVHATHASLWRLPESWSIPGPPAPPGVQRMRLASPTPEQAPEYRWVGSTARAAGTVVHAELHRLAAASQAAMIATQPAALPDYGAWLAELGVAPDEQRAAGAQVQQAIARTLADPRGRWLLSNSHAQTYSEWRLTGVHQGRVVNIVIDRMLVDEHGQRWIVDFKTSVHQGGAQRDFIDSEAERYRPQLLRYAALARQLGREPVRLALYFPLLGVFREIDSPAG
jgi:ATP-dependent helicase/nuclease subunit A